MPPLPLSVTHSTRHMESTTTEDPIASQRTNASNIGVGIGMILLSIACFISYSWILCVVYGDKELMKMASYKIMFVLGIFDLTQLLPHTVTGFMNIFQTVFSPTLAKAMGVIATPSYVCYAVLTIILSVNRLVPLLSAHWDGILFSPRGTQIWIGAALLCCLLFALALASPWASILYYPEYYSWAYDHSRPYSYIVERVEMVIEVGGIFVSGLIYLMIVTLLYRKRKRFSVSKNFRLELKILIQAFVITAYCTILNVFWHFSQYILPNTLAAYCGLNFMWIANAGIYPVIYVLVNKAIRNKVTQARTQTIQTLAISSISAKDKNQRLRNATNKLFVTRRQ